jgi:dolichol-phosphate mannosyltransferase
MCAAEISVVLPIYNEAGALPTLIGEITTALAGTERSFEILCVDDASTDESPYVIACLSETTPQVRRIAHARNCGQSAAVATGFLHAAGEIIITLDADGQNVPADIPHYLDALTDDVDCVCGVRKGRQDSFAKRVASSLANRFRIALTGSGVSDAGCGFRVVRREALVEVPHFNGMHRWLPTMLLAQGCKVVEIEIAHRPRTTGVSKYGINDRLWRGILDCFGMRWYRMRALPHDRVRRSPEDP